MSMNRHRVGKNGNEKITKRDVENRTHTHTHKYTKIMALGAFSLLCMRRQIMFQFNECVCVCARLRFFGYNRAWFKWKIN